MKFLANLSSFLLLVILFINFLSYFFTEIYFKIQNPNLKKQINSLLPLMSKKNELLKIGVVLLFVATFYRFLFATTSIVKIVLLFILYTPLIFDLSSIFPISKEGAFNLRMASSYLIPFILILYLV